METTDNSVQKEAEIVAGVIKDLPNAIQDLPNKITEELAKNFEKKDSESISELKKSIKDLNDELQLIKNKEEAKNDNANEVVVDFDFSINKSETFNKFNEFYSSPKATMLELDSTESFKIKKSVDFIINNQNTVSHKIKKLPDDIVATYEKNKEGKSFLYDMVKRSTKSLRDVRANQLIGIKIRDLKNNTVIESTVNSENKKFKKTGSIMADTVIGMGFGEFEASFDVTSQVLRDSNLGVFKIDPVAEEFGKIMAKKETLLSRVILNGEISSNNGIKCGHQGLLTEANPTLSANRFAKGVPVPTYATNNYVVKAIDLITLVKQVGSAYITPSTIMIIPEPLLLDLFLETAADGHKTFGENFETINGNLFLKTHSKNSIRVMVADGLDSSSPTDEDSLAFLEERKMGFEDYKSFTDSNRVINSLYDPAYGSASEESNKGKVFAILLSDPVNCYNLYEADVSYLTKPQLDQHTQYNKVAHGMYEFYSSGIPINNRGYAIGYISNSAT